VVLPVSFGAVVRKPWQIPVIFNHLQLLNLQGKFFRLMLFELFKALLRA
jgi:hypothetical protein